MRFGAALRARTGSDNQTWRMEGGPRGGLPDRSKERSGRAKAVSGGETAAKLCGKPGKAGPPVARAGPAAAVQTAQRMQSGWEGECCSWPPAAPERRLPQSEVARSRSSAAAAEMAGAGNRPSSAGMARARITAWATQRRYRPSRDSQPQCMLRLYQAAAALSPLPRVAWLPLVSRQRNG